MPFFLGIDGGGTRTTAWLADERSRVLAKSVAGPSNPLKVGFAVAERAILWASMLALRKGRLKPASLDAVCVGVAGVDRPAVHQRLLVWLRQSIPARAHCVTSDAAIALEAALGNAAGIIVIAGTGSIAYGRNDSGVIARAGGWGLPFDDAGSGYDLGRKAIAAALRAHDGRGPRTQLGAALCRMLQLREITQVVQRQLASREVASLAPLVMAVARRGDSVARRLRDEAARDLADLAFAVLARLRLRRSAVRVVCAGGVFQASAGLRRRFARYLRRRAPNVRVSALRHSPVEGALALARRVAAHPGSE